MLVLQETVTDGTGNLIQKIVYTIGHDHISQSTWRAGNVNPPSVAVFHFDGHGNTRILTDLAGSIITLAGLLQVYHYDAYGNALNFTMSAAAATQYLYSGEQFDPRIGQQYLRARYYDSATGTFNRLDPFFGNQTDPQSFHKYLYTHGDPVNGVDPSGLAGLFLADMGTVIHEIITSFYRSEHPGLEITSDLRLRGRPDWVKPDIANYDQGTILEIKPLTVGGIADGELQLRAGLAMTNGFPFSYRNHDFQILPRVPHQNGNAEWAADTLDPGVRVLHPGVVDAQFSNWVALSLFNVNVVVYFQRFFLPKFTTLFGLSALIAKGFAESMKHQLQRDIQFGFALEDQENWDYRFASAAVLATGISLTLEGIAVVGAANALRGIPSYSIRLPRFNAPQISPVIGAII